MSPRAKKAEFVMYQDHPNDWVDLNDHDAVRKKFESKNEALCDLVRQLNDTKHQLKAATAPGPIRCAWPFVRRFLKGVGFGAAIFAPLYLTYRMFGSSGPGVLVAFLGLGTLCFMVGSLMEDA